MNTNPANLVFADPRPAWDARAGELDQAEARLSQYLEVAQRLGDAAAIAAAETRLADLRSARDVYSRQREAVDLAFAQNAEALAQLRQANAAWSEGTDDPKTALALHHDVIVAEAMAAFTRAPIRGLCASAGPSRERASRAMIGPEGAVMQETEELMRLLLENRSTGPALDFAMACGKRANAGAATWWLVAEALARETFKKRANVSKRDEQDFEKDWRRETPFRPTEAHLEQAFVQRRAAFASERARVAAQLAALTGTAAALEGGAS